jgi:L-ribulose-5-phosphate 3-epimerase UlaE
MSSFSCFFLQKKRIHQGLERLVVGVKGSFTDFIDFSLDSSDKYAVGIEYVNSERTRFSSIDHEVTLDDSFSSRLLSRGRRFFFSCADARREVFSNNRCIEESIHWRGECILHHSRILSTGFEGFDEEEDDDDDDVFVDIAP